jgi:hypothetical protein
MHFSRNLRVQFLFKKIYSIFDTSNFEFIPFTIVKNNVLMFKITCKDKKTAL